MVKQSPTIPRLLPMNCLSVFDHFVGLARKGLTSYGYHKLNNFFSCKSSSQQRKTILSNNNRNDAFNLFETGVETPEQHHLK